MLDLSILSKGAAEIIAGVGDTLDGVGDFVNVNCAWFAYHALNIPGQRGTVKGNRKDFGYKLQAKSQKNPSLITSYVKNGLGTPV